MSFLSQQLVANGFPPLHPQLYTRENSVGETVFSLSGSQLEYLKGTVMTILEECNRKNEMNQALLLRLSQAERVTTQERQSLTLSPQQVSELNVEKNDYNSIKEDLERARRANERLLLRCHALESTNAASQKGREDLERALERLQLEKEDVENKVQFNFFDILNHIDFEKEISK